MDLQELHDAVTKMKEELDVIMKDLPGTFKTMPVGINVVQGESIESPFLFFTKQDDHITHGLASIELDGIHVVITTQELK